MMDSPSNPHPVFGQVLKISRSDRWLVYHRLQELKIPCWCPADGSLWVEVNDCTSALLVRSTLQQLMASRQELLDWLQRCWNARIS